MSLNSKELAYITDCLAYKLFPGRAFPAPVEGMDWDKLYALIESHRLSGLFFTLGQGTDMWPVSFIDRLRLDYYQYSLYGHQCSQRIKTLLETVSDLGVRVIVLKGWAHIQTIYDKDYGQRLCEDIDILIHPRDINAVDGVLKKLGWIQEKEGWPGYDRRYLNGTRYFFENGKTDFAGTFSVGLHWGLVHIPSYDPGRTDVDLLFTNALRLDVMGVPVLQLAPEDEVVYLCGHIGLHHRFDSALFRYFELAALILRVGLDLDWQGVIETSIKWRYILSARRVLCRINQLWDGVIRTEILDAFAVVRCSFQEFFVSSWIERTRGFPIFDHILNWITFPRIWERPLIMLQDIFPNSEYMLARYGSAPLGFWPLLYVRRFFRALRFL